MFFFIYHSEPNLGNLYYGITQAALREILKSHFIYDASNSENSFFSKDFFTSLNIFAYYNEKLELLELNLPVCGEFLYQEFSLYSDYRSLKNHLRKNDIKYSLNKNNMSLTLENENITIIYDQFDDFANAKVRSIKLSFLSKNFSISLERVATQTFPNKYIYSKNNIHEQQVPKIGVFFQHQIHFASFGKSKATKIYLNHQIELINSGKFIDSIKIDIAEIKSKTVSKYSSDLNKMLEFAGTLPTTKFMTISPESPKEKEKLNAL